VARLACFLLILALAGRALALEPEQLFEQVSPSVWTVRTFDENRKSMSQGSAVVVARGKVVTNCHVVAKSRFILVMREKVRHLATLELPDPERDLCQLDVPKLDAPVIRIGNPQALRIGQRVYAIGNPRGLELTMSEGIVSALRAGRQGQLVQTTAPISRGSSGGGLFDADGRLVGITTRTVADAQNLNIAIPSSWIADLGERAPAVLERARNHVPPLAHLSDILPAPVRAPGTPGGPPRPASPEPPKPVAMPEPSAAAPQPAPVVVALPPAFPRAGDTWTYAHIDLRYRPDDRSRRYVHTIRSSSVDAIVEEIAVNDLVVATRTHTRALEATWRSNVLEVAPFLLAFRRLGAGDRFGPIPIAGIGGANVATGDEALVLRGARVGEREQVTVPAGSFEAVRTTIEAGAALAWLNPNDTARGHRDVTVTVWHAPAVRRSVRVLVEGPGIAEAYELLSFKSAR